MMTESVAPKQRAAVHSFLNEYPPLPPAEAMKHFATKLALETDSHDVSIDMERRTTHVIIVDVRSELAYAECRIPGSINIPYRSINATSVANIPKDAIIVTYCWGPHCNGATKGAMKLSALGFRVKEMLGGLEYWRHDELPVEGTLGTAAPMYG